MPTPDIVLIGASVRSMARSAIRDGWHPVCVDMFGDADLMQMLDNPDIQFRRICSFLDVPSVLSGIPENLPVVVGGGLENEPAVLRELNRSHRLCGSKQKAVAAVRSPQTLFSAASAGGCRVPAWKSADDAATAGRAERLRWLIKSERSSGGLGISDFKGGSDCLVSGSHSYLQQFVHGIPVSSTFFSRGSTESDVRLLGAALQLSGRRELNAPRYHFCGNAGPLRLSKALEQQMVRTGQVVADRFSLNGVFGIDFVLNDEGLWILEVNPRVTASHELHEWSSPGGPGHVTLQVLASISDATPIVPDRIRQNHIAWLPETDNATPSHSSGDSPITRVSGPAKNKQRFRMVRMIVYARRDTRISPEESARMLRLARNATVSESPDDAVFPADIPEAHTTIPRGNPLCSVYVNPDTDWKLPLADLLTCLRVFDFQRLEKLTEEIQGDLDGCSEDFEFAK